MATPHLTPAERSAALEKAMAARTRRAALLVALKGGEMPLGDFLALAEEDEVVASTKVSTVLAALPGVGPARAAQAMDRVGVAPTRRVRGLGRHQRAGLVDYFS